MQPARASPTRTHITLRVLLCCRTTRDSGRASKRHPGRAHRTDTSSLTIAAGVRFLPGIVPVDDAGVIRYRHEGTPLDAETLSQVIARIKNKS